MLLGKIRNSNTDCFCLEGTIGWPGRKKVEGIYFAFKSWKFWNLNHVNGLSIQKTSQGNFKLFQACPQFFTTLRSRQSPIS